jgi:prevent-host-death family protein
MTTRTTAADAQSRLSELLDAVAGGRETVVITREGKPDVALVDAAELDSLREHLHVLTPLENARALAEALARADRGEGIRLTAEALRALADEAEHAPHRVAATLAELERSGHGAPASHRQSAMDGDAGADEATAEETRTGEARRAGG